MADDAPLQPTMVNGASSITDINAQGWLTSMQQSSYDDEVFSRVVRPDGSFTDLLSRGSSENARARGINDAGWIAGDIGPRDPVEFYKWPAVWDPTGKLIELEHVQDFNTSPRYEVWGVNNARVTVGWVSRYPNNTKGIVSAVTWNQKGRLSTLAARGMSTQAKDISNTGFIVGAAGPKATWSWNFPELPLPVRWGPKGSMSLLPPLLPGDTKGTAVAVNDSGFAVGSSSNETETHAVMWTPAGKVVQLPELPGDGSSRATSINSAGTVGVSNDLAVWWPTTSSVRTLGVPEIPPSSDETLVIRDGTPTAINDSGTIAGFFAYWTGEAVWAQGFTWQS